MHNQKACDQTEFQRRGPQLSEIGALLTRAADFAEYRHIFLSCQEGTGRGFGTKRNLTGMRMAPGLRAQIQDGG